MKQKVAISWSSGKDSAYTFYRLANDPKFEIAALVTTYNSATGRLPIQGTPIEAVREQARCIGIPLIEIDLPENCPNNEYEKRLVDGLNPHIEKFRHLAFGDLFLDGIKDYRESFLRPAGFELIFPLLGSATPVLAKEIITAGFLAKVCSVDSTQLDRAFTGRNFDPNFLVDLPSHIDPCGEKGEFHTFVYGGPIFQARPQCSFGPAETFDRFTFLAIQAE